MAVSGVLLGGLFFHKWLPHFKFDQAFLDKAGRIG